MGVAGCASVIGFSHSSTSQSLILIEEFDVYLRLNQRCGERCDEVLCYFRNFGDGTNNIFQLVIDVKTLVSHHFYSFQTKDPLKI